VSVKEKFKTIAVHLEVYKQLAALQNEITQRTGIRPSMSELIKLLIRSYQAHKSVQNRTEGS